MRIGCLQFAPRVGDVDNNISKADAILESSEVEQLELLVLPELAFSGYNFRSLQHISPFLEHSGSGITSLWARNAALKYDCTVIAGYPEKVDLTDQWPADPQYYNSAIVVNEDGETIGNYRKSHLYYTDETWALEGRSFFRGNLPGLGPTAMGICMDLNPYKFQTPWSKFEFARHVLDCGATLVVVSMAWLTNDAAATFTPMTQEPDMASLMYWISRFEPVIRAESDEEVIIVLANRTGTEDEATYVGTSTVLGIKSGEVRLYGILGRGDKELLVVDTNTRPYLKLVYDPDAGALILGTDGGVGHGGVTEDPRPFTGNTAKAPESSTHFADANAQTDHPDTSTRPAATYRRDDLFIQLPSKEPDGEQFKSPAVHTPEAPSPTPHSIRPNLMSPPVQSGTERYLKPRSPGSIPPSWLSNASDVGSSQMPDEHSLRSRPRPSYLISPSFASESRFSQSSMDSSRMYWMPLGNPDAVPKDLNWDTLDESDDAIISEPEDEHSMRANRNRFSIRSDVSVWNNQPGRPPSIASPLSPLMHLLAFNEPTRPESATMPVDRDDYSRIDMGGTLTNSAHDGPRMRGEGHYHHSPSTRRQEISHERKPSKTSSHNMGSDSTTGGPRARPSSATTNHQASLNQRPASENRVQDKNSQHRERSQERPQSHNDAGRPGRTVSGSRAGAGPRQVSRGRQNIPIVNDDERSRAVPTREEPRASSASQRPPEPVDLSQYTLIEEYPSPNCPMHGSRSLSRTRSGQRSGSAARPLTQRKSHSSMRTERRSHSALATQQEPNVTRSKPTSQKEKKTSRPATSLAQGSKQNQYEPRIVERLVQSKPSSSKPTQEPKTPVAMMLVYDANNTEGSEEATATKFSRIDKVVKPLVSRPRSAVW